MTHVYAKDLATFKQKTKLARVVLMVVIVHILLVSPLNKFFQKLDFGDQIRMRKYLRLALSFTLQLLLNWQNKDVAQRQDQKLGNVKT